MKHLAETGPRKRVASGVAVLLVVALALGGQAATTKAAAGGRSYVVRAGDTLSAISVRFGTSTRAIASANNIKNPNIIVIGRKLSIPASSGASSGGSSNASGGSSSGMPAKLLRHPDRVALRPTFEKWAAHYGVPADLLEALAWVESGWQRTVVSPTGAIGIGQLQPDTVDHVRLLIGIKTLDPYNSSDNIRMSARFVRYLLDATGGDVRTALAAYYQGLRSVRTSPVLAETKQYVQTVLVFRPMFR
jgi:murein DD-endopeptidase MepM/ murein hydrolase activator NlpD